MRITCPQCGFFRELPDNKVPVTSTMATCPKCRHRFRFRPEATPSKRESRLAEPRESSLSTPASENEGESSWRRSGPAAARLRQAEAHDPVATPLPEEISAPTPEPAPERAPVASDPIEPRSEPSVAARTVRQRRHELVDEPPAVPEAPHWSDMEDPPLPPEDVLAPPRGHDAGTAKARPVVVPDESPTASPVIEESVQPSRPEPVAPAEEPAPAAPAAAAPVAPTPTVDLTPPEAPSEPVAPAPKTRRKLLDKDGVRDIWARLQAMDERPKSRPKADKPEANGTERAERPASEPPITDPIPWERLDSYGFLPGLGLTLRQILLSPGEFFAAMPEGRPKGKALVFNLLISEFLFVIDFLWSLFGLRGKWAEPGNADLLGSVTASPGLGFLLILLLVPPLLSVGVYLDAWLTHLLLLLFRSAKKGFSETFRVLCYSAAPTTLSAVPVAGQLLSPIILVWYMAIQAIGLTKVHQGGLTQTLAAVFIKWSLYLFLLLAMLQSFSPGH